VVSERWPSGESLPRGGDARCRSADSPCSCLKQSQIEMMPCTICVNAIVGMGIRSSAVTPSQPLQQCTYLVTGQLPGGGDAHGAVPCSSCSFLQVGSKSMDSLLS